MPTDALKRAERVEELRAALPAGPFDCFDDGGYDEWAIVADNGSTVAQIDVGGEKFARFLTVMLNESGALAADVRQLVTENGKLWQDLAEEAAHCQALKALWEACKPLAQHDPQVADLAQALGLLPPREDKPEPTLAERIAGARMHLADLKAARKRAVGQDTYDHIDEQVSNAQEYLAELEDEARESAPQPVTPEEADRNDLLAAEFSREDKLSESARCGDGKESV